MISLLMNAVGGRPFVAVATVVVFIRWTFTCRIRTEAAFHVPRTTDITGADKAINQPSGKPMSQPQLESPVVIKFS